MSTPPFFLADDLPLYPFSFQGNCLPLGWPVIPEIGTWSESYRHATLAAYKRTEFKLADFVKLLCKKQITLQYHSEVDYSFPSGNPYSGTASGSADYSFDLENTSLTNGYSLFQFSQQSSIGFNVNYGHDSKEQDAPCQLLSNNTGSPSYGGYIRSLQPSVGISIVQKSKKLYVSIYCQVQSVWYVAINPPTYLPVLVGTFIISTKDITGSYGGNPAAYVRGTLNFAGVECHTLCANASNANPDSPVTENFTISGIQLTAV